MEKVPDTFFNARRRKRFLTPFFVVALGVAAAMGPREAAAGDDAWLHDVCFVSPTVGWAVGDRGVIWHTDDGGAHWRLQASGVEASLRSVCFVDERLGWVAGAQTRPFTRQRQSVLLQTKNGGKTWMPLDSFLLPPAAKIRFYDANNGWAVGAASPEYPAGVMQTQDGGRSWRPVPGEADSPWTTGDLIGTYAGALGGRLGAVGVLRKGLVAPGREPAFGPRTLRGLCLVRPTWGWLVGDGALVMLTGDLGATWRIPPGALPPGTVENFDFAALAVRGPRCWALGKPGSKVFFTADAGQSWTSFPTGQTLPLSAVAFADDQHGWAVGALGTILNTSDGGRTWARQRSPARRAAVLGVFGRPGDVPWEIFAQVCGEEGHLGVADVLFRDEPREPAHGDATIEERLHEATVEVGAAGGQLAWRFPLRSAGLGLGAAAIVRQWDEANGGRGRQALLEHLVRQIRQWRPEVVWTHAPDPTADAEAAEARLVNEAVLEAVALAADSGVFPSQIRDAGLAPWEVKRVFGVFPGPGGSIEVKTSRTVPRWGCSLGDVAAEARGRIDDRYRPGPDAFGCQALIDRVPQPPGRQDFLRGIALQPGGETRRSLPPPENANELHAMAQRTRIARAVMRRMETDPARGSQLLAQVDSLIQGMDEAAAGRVLHRLAEQYKARGQWEDAAQTLRQLDQRFPRHPLTDDALAWLVRYYASGEAAWRVQGEQRYILSGNGLDAKSAVSTDASKQTNRPELAAAFARRIQTTRAALFNEPTIRFPLAAADRARGNAAEAERFMNDRRRTPPRDAWRTCALGEAWLAARAGQPPKPVVRCPSVPEKPYLDGKLDEPFWRGKGIEPVRLTSPRADDQAWPAEAWLARDEAFLYLAIACRKAPGVDYPAGQGPRPRDPILSRRDRVEVLLDLDRDFTTYFRLTIDHRGWPAEDCWGDPTWNPRWVVAAAADETSWTFEAAIPFDQLTGRPPRPGDAWAVGLRRFVPGLGMQSAAQRDTFEVSPEAFGYLVF